MLSKLSDEHVVALPVNCPRCGESSWSEFPIALTQWNNMALYCHCHESNWSASPAEILGIRVYLGKDWLDSHQQIGLKP
jgi:hypothetical protein